MTKIAATILSLCLVLIAASASAQVATTKDTTNGPSVGIFTTSLPSALNIDVEHERVTLPLHKGRTRIDGRTFWYVVSDSSDQADAKQRGVNYSNKMLNAVGTAAIQNGRFDGDTLVVDGTVNFGLTHVLVPGPNGFPPTQFAPGAVGDSKYSALVLIAPANSGTTGLVLNAPQVANETGVSGSVVAIDYEKKP